jgi:hypothetical protein
MQPLQYPENTVYKIRGLEGEKIIGASNLRHERMDELIQALLAKDGPIDLEDIRAIQSNHRDDPPNLNCICSHGQPIANSLSGTVMDPRAKKFYICEGNPCKGEPYQELSFGSQDD